MDRWRTAARRMAAAAALAAALAQTLPARADPQGASVSGASDQPVLTAPTPAPSKRARWVEEVCRTLAQAAADNALPEEFFTRLIWQESRFDPRAVSPAGAQGIAQFMPQTAAMRGLADAFEPLEALRESASYLSELRATFGGNLGLAAAAYNAGPSRVEDWLAGRRSLPFETQAYVLIVTGHAAQAWTNKPPPQLAFSAPPPADASNANDPPAKAPAPSPPIGARCVQLAKLMAENARHHVPLTSNPAWGPWGVQLKGSYSEGGVLAAYERLRRRFSAVLGDRLPLVLHGRRGRGAAFVVRVSEKSRADANALCARLRAAGGVCVVLRNPRS